jgi:poly(hydroxyalkanoate) depolymerase family esterase
MPWWMSQSGDVEHPSPMARWAAAATRKFRRVWQGEAGMLLTDSPAPASLPLITSDAPETRLAPASPQPRRAAFTRQVFEFEGERYGFNLYVPPQAVTLEDSAPRLPLLVMLHGCQQDAPDFARGTGMNELAAQTPCMVLYPEQLTTANQMRCWNWYDIAHQGPHAGEPAMLAALTQLIISRYPVDAARVYIAGLSAGGAMAAIVAAHHPRLFAAVGVHSGLPPGAAHDVMSAFKAMRHGGHPHAPGDPAALEDVMPTIVFHGSADDTVHPDNSERIVKAAAAALAASGVTLQRSVQPQTLPAATGELRQALRTVYRRDTGRSYVEYWSVESGPHAWSGGHPEGSFTDPHGPSASAAMLAFFLQHRR